MQTKIGELISHNLSSRIKAYTSYKDWLEVSKDPRSKRGVYTLRNVLNGEREVDNDVLPSLILLAQKANENAKKVAQEASHVADQLYEWQKEADAKLLKRLKQKV